MTHIHDLTQQHQKIVSQGTLRNLFQQDPARFEQFSMAACGIFLDYSKNWITQETVSSLIHFANHQKMAESIESLFSGGMVNATEQRPALHTVLRNPPSETVCLGETNLTSLVQQTLGMMEYCADILRRGRWLGYSGKSITDIVHIGIGGSHLGMVLVSEALKSSISTNLRCHFVSSVDATQLNETLNQLNPETTLFIIASKTFTTTETLVNTDRAKAWLELAGCPPAHLTQHFLATTANREAAIAYGINPQYILPTWDWVGGRYSLWSSMGLPLAILLGMSTFQELLAGAHAMDQHFRHTELRQNMPVILGLLGYWYTSYFHTTAQAILPYDYRLRHLPRYLQQLEMESNGKSVQLNGKPVETLTTPILFGEMGTDGQHSFHQLLFQGTQTIPCDFIATIQHESPTAEQPLLLAHCFAQSQALMWGKTQEEAEAELRTECDPAQAKWLAAHKTIRGNQPSNTLLLDQLTPHTLGSLIALYEHKVFVEGILWNINSFDQWGVELGKQIAKQLLPGLTTSAQLTNFDCSTQGLINYVKHKGKTVC